MGAEEQLEKLTPVEKMEKPEEGNLQLFFQNLLEGASKIHDRYYCKDALYLTFRYLSLLPDDSREKIFEDTLIAISKVDGNSEDSYYVQSLINLLHYLPEPWKNRALLEAWEAVSSIHDPTQYASTLKELLPHLSDFLKQEALKKLLEVADNLSGVDDRASTFSNLVPDLPEPLKQQAATKALTAISQIDSAYSCSYSLKSLLPHLPATSLTEALAVAQKIDVLDYRVSALNELIPHLPEPLKQEAATEALRAISQIDSGYSRSSSLRSLLPNLPKVSLVEARAVAQKIDDLAYRVLALKELIPYLPEPLQPEVVTDAMTAIGQIEGDSSRSSSLISIISHLSTPALLEDAFSITQKIDAPSERTSVLKKLVPNLTEPLRQQALDNLLKAINDSQEISERIQSLTEIIPYLSESVKTRLLEQESERISNIDEYYEFSDFSEIFKYFSPRLVIKCLSFAIRINNEFFRDMAVDDLLERIPDDALSEAFSELNRLQIVKDRVLALLALMPRLLEPLKQQAIGVILAGISDLSEPDIRLLILRKLASYLSGQDKQNIKVILATVCDLSEASDRASILREIASHLPEEEKQKLIESALEAIVQIENDYFRSSSLVSTIPYIPSALFNRAISIAETIIDSSSRTSVLKELALYVSPELLTRVLSSAEEISSVKDRIQVLTVLAPRLPEMTLYQAKTRCLNEIRDIESVSDLTEALAALIPHLKNDLLYEALRIARNIQDPVEAEARLEAIDELARRISTEFADVDDWTARRERAEENESIDRRFTKAPRSRARLLADLFFRFEGEQQTQIFEELLAAIDEIPAEPCKSRTLISLANYLPKLEGRKVLEKSLTIVRGILKDTWTIALENHLSHLPTSLLKSAIELALTRAENYLFGGSRRWWEPNMIHFSEQEPRYFNICLKEPSTNTDLSSDEPLVFNQSYQLRVNISSVVGGLGEEDIFVGEALRDSWGDKETLPLTVIAESKDFEIEQDNRVQTLNLPRKGSSQTIDFQVKPCISMGSGTIRVYLFYRGYFLQSKEIKALILDTAGSKVPGALTARRLNATQDFINPNELHLLPERMLTINVAADTKDQSITLTFLNRVNGDEELICHDTELPSDALVGMISGIRNLLELMIAGTVTKGVKLDGQDVRGYANILSGDNKMLNIWLPRLAEVGYNLYRLLFDNEGQESEESTKALLSTLQPGTVIQVNNTRDVLGMTTIPWALLYQRETSYIPGLTQVCEESINPSTPERRDCSGCPLAEDPDTVCPFAFWGYRYSIEQLPAWRSNEASDRIPSLVRTIRNNKPLNLNLIVYPGFKMWDGHRQEIEKIGPESIQLRLAKEGKIAEVKTHWDSYGTELDLIYFYTHGDMDKTTGQPYLKLSDIEMIRSNFLSRYKGKWTKKPLVILNGCATGDYKSDSYVSLITDFRQAGASGVVGSECSVPESFAVPYANQLLSHLFKGKPLGQAMLNVRLQFLKENRNPLGLVYSLYAAHEIALAQALSS